MIKKIYDFIIRIASNVLFVVFGIMILFSIFIKSVYYFQNDSPGFELVNILDVLAIFLWGLILAIFWKFKDWISLHLKKKWIILSFFLTSLLFVIMLPLKPFSDMEQIYNAASKVAIGDFSYFANNSYFMQYPNNILVSLLYGGLLFIFPKNILTIKILNILLIIGITIISCKIINLIYKNEISNLFYIYSLSFLSVFLYANHLYTDILFVFISVLGVYIYLKNDKFIILDYILYSVLYFIRPQAVFYIIAITIGYLVKSKNTILRKVINILLGVSIFFLINAGFKYGVERVLIGDIDSAMPVASYVYMAFNEQKFGFQDGLHDLNRTFNDVKYRLNSYNFKTVIAIILKKIQWMWTEGTYQAQRYAFGGDENGKFLYDTIISKYCINSKNLWRRFLDSLMRAQYLWNFGLTLPMFISKKKFKFEIIIMLFAANFIFYIFWEIKSRYILPLYPFMLIVSFITCIEITKKISKKAN